MKKIILITLFATLLFAQEYQIRTTRTIFYDKYGDCTMTVPQDSVKLNGSEGYYAINTVATAADSAQSGKLFKGPVECTQTIYAGVDNVSGTVNVLIYYGVWRGLEGGWLWTQIGSITADGTVTTLDINDTSVLSWSRNRMVDTWGIKFKESGNQANKIWVRIVEKEVK